MKAVGWEAGSQKHRENSHMGGMGKVCHKVGQARLEDLE